MLSRFVQIESERARKRKKLKELIFKYWDACYKIQFAVDEVYIEHARLYQNQILEWPSYVMPKLSTLIGIKEAI